MKKAIIILLTVVVACGAIFAGALIYGRLSSMSAMKIEYPEISLGPIPMSHTYIGEIAPGLPFRIDTGSSVNTISHAYLERLKQMGFDVDSSTVLTMARTAVGGQRIATKRYRVSLPIYSYDIQVEGSNVTSRIDTTNLINRIDGVDFVLIGNSKEIPRLGRPFLKQFFVEFDYDIRSMRFHRQMPEGYQEVSDMNRELAVFFEPALFLDLTVKGQRQQYFINSSMPRVILLEPSGNAPKPDNVSVYADSLHSIYGNRPAIIDYSAWVEWADRAGNSVCYFSDYGHRPYAINPFNFITQDALFDFRNNKIYLRPYSPKSRHLRSNDVFITDDSI